MKIKTNMRGFQLWMKLNPRKRTDGFFTFRGKALNHNQVKAMVDYAVEKGYQTEADIPADEIVKLLDWEEQT
mgnify:CR=1 FL=1